MSHPSAVECILMFADYMNGVLVVLIYHHHQPINAPTAGAQVYKINYRHTYNHRLSINRLTKRGKENSRSDGHCQCEKEMEDHLLACQ
jgi:hypothetical protein